MKKEAAEILEKAGVKATPNRVLVLDALLRASSPLSLIELETELQTVERSSVLRSLNAMLERDVIHILEDGKGISKYEVCHGSEHSLEDMHLHFYCERCGRTTCLEDIPMPDIILPRGYDLHSANFMLKGVCPDCSAKSR